MNNRVYTVTAKIPEDRKLMVELPGYIPSGPATVTVTFQDSEDDVTKCPHRRGSPQAVLWAAQEANRRYPFAKRKTNEEIDVIVQEMMDARE